ncbi:MAG: F0F1 ATP synthase subunit delta [Moraxellaceae bacterium]|nr:F0F1 ATP synthase subunit delta [Moraxellaceae bacterium]
MAENLTLARPYAEAVFVLARDAGTLPSWAQALDGLAAVASAPEVRDLIGDPRVVPAQVVEVLAGGSLSPEQHNFVQVLVANGRAELLPEIRELFVEEKNRFDGVRDAVVSSAFPMDDAALQQLAADLAPRFGALRMSVRIDPELIGGVRVAVDDEVLDASVRGKLEAMAAALQN